MLLIGSLCINTSFTVFLTDLTNNSANIQINSDIPKIEVLLLKKVQPMMNKVFMYVESIIILTFRMVSKILIFLFPYLPILYK